MNIEDILQLEPFEKQIAALCRKQDGKDVTKWRAQYEGIHDILKRKIKIVGTGQNRREVPQAKEVLPFQKKITDTAVSFVFGEPVKLVLNTGEDSLAEAFKLIQDTWRQNKLDYINRQLMRTVCIESEAAELWYAVREKGRKTRVKVVLLSEATGNKIYPHLNEFGDMDAFTRRYELEDAYGRKHEHIDIYTADTIISGVRRQQWEIEEKPNLFGKIPVIYYCQDRPEWADVQSLIDRLEMLISKHADTNDYYGSPMIKLRGRLVAMPDKTEDGKMLQFSADENTQTGEIEYGDAEYLTWDHSPESIKLEVENLKEFIYSMTATPDISFNNIKGVGNVSGIALRFMFLDSLLKAKDKQEIYGTGLTRRINLLKAILSVVDVKQAANLEKLDISVEFGNPLPENIQDIIQTLALARPGEPIMSKETAVRYNPFVNDPIAEIALMKHEQGQTAALQ